MLSHRYGAENLELIMVVGAAQSVVGIVCLIIFGGGCADACGRPRGHFWRSVPRRTSLEFGAGGETYSAFCTSWFLRFLVVLVVVVEMEARGVPASCVIWCRWNREKILNINWFNVALLEGTDNKDRAKG